jgi:hypothetical protein
MKTSALQEFLRSLAAPLAAIGVAPKSLDDLHTAAQSLEPFKDLDLEQLVDFLRRAADFRRDGKVPALSVSGLDQITSAARSLSEDVHLVGAGGAVVEGQIESRIAQGQRDLQSGLDTLSRQFGLTLKFGQDKKWLSSLQAKAKSTRMVESFRRLAAQITEPASFKSESVESGVEALAASDAKVLKAAATELGVSGTRTGKAFVESVLVKLTGIDNKPQKATKKPKPSEPTASDEQVEAMIRTLQNLVARAKVPSSVADAEIEVVLLRVSSEFSTDQQKAIAKRVTGNGGRSAKDAIERLRADLTAVKRLLESQRV